MPPMWVEFEIDHRTADNVPHSLFFTKNVWFINTRPTEFVLYARVVRQGLWYIDLIRED